MGRDGQLKRAFLEPLLIEDYQPRGIAGWPQQRMARDLLALSDAVMAMDDGALELDLARRSSLEERSYQVGEPGTGWSAPQDMREGWVVAVESEADWRLGRDLLLVGDFEDFDIDEEVAEGQLWEVNSASEMVTHQAASSGHYGLRLIREDTSLDPVYSSPIDRIPIEDSSALTITGQVRSEGTVTVQVSWYDSMEGTSLENESTQIETSADWAPFQLDVEPPEGSVAVGLYLKLYPPNTEQMTADFDELRLIAWTEGMPEDPERYDQLQVEDAATVTVRRREMPVGW